MKFSILITTLFLSSCAYVNMLKVKKEESKKLNGDLKYEFVDTMGSFIKLKKTGLDTHKNIIVKSIIYAENKENAPVEKLISISTPSQKISNIKLLEPHKSETVYWFDGQRYKSIISINQSSQQITAIAIASEKEWNKKKVFKINLNKRAYCFFSQIIECVKESGFFEKSRVQRSGAMNLEIIWDGFPFFNEQYLNNKTNLMSRGKFSFVGKETKNLFKYALNVDGQIIHYFIYQDKHLAKMFWVSQGISQTLME